MISRIVSFILLPIRLVVITKLFSQCSVLNRRIHEPEWPRQKIKQNIWSLAIHRSNTLMKIYRCCSRHKCPLLACRSPIHCRRSPQSAREKRPIFQPGDHQYVTRKAITLLSRIHCRIFCTACTGELRYGHTDEGTRPGRTESLVVSSQRAASSSVSASVVTSPDLRASWR